MNRLASLRATILLLALLLAAGCASGSPGAPPETTGDGTEDSTGPAPETTQKSGTTEELSGGARIEQISSGSDGLRRPQVVVGSSAGALSEEIGAEVPDAGEGTYLAAFWGEKPTGGYTVEIISAWVEGSRVIVRLALKEPPPEAMVGQALTYPNAAAVLRGVDPGEKEFVLVTRAGREPGWPVRNV